MLELLHPLSTTSTIVAPPATTQGCTSGETIRPIKARGSLVWWCVLPGDTRLGQRGAHGAPGEVSDSVLVALLLAAAIGYALSSWPEGSSRGEPESPHRFTEPAWARAVLTKADLQVTGSTGSALVAEGNGVSIFFWVLERPATAGAKRNSQQQGYEFLRSIKGIEVYSDGLRLSWQTSGVYVWLQGRPPSTLSDVGNKTIEAIVGPQIRVRPSKVSGHQGGNERRDRKWRQSLFEVELTPLH